MCINRHRNDWNVRNAAQCNTQISGIDMETANTQNGTNDQRYENRIQSLLDNFSDFGPITRTEQWLYI